MMSGVGVMVSVDKSGPGPSTGVAYQAPSSRGSAAPCFPRDHEPRFVCGVWLD